MRPHMSLMGKNERLAVRKYVDLHKSQMKVMTNENNIVSEVSYAHICLSLHCQSPSRFGICISHNDLQQPSENGHVLVAFESRVDARVFN